MTNNKGEYLSTYMNVYVYEGIFGQQTFFYVLLKAGDKDHLDSHRISIRMFKQAMLSWNDELKHHKNCIHCRS